GSSAIVEIWRAPPARATARSLTTPWSRPWLAPSSGTNTEGRTRAGPGNLPWARRLDRVTRNAFSSGFAQHSGPWWNPPGRYGFRWLLQGRARAARAFELDAPLGAQSRGERRRRRGSGARHLGGGVAPALGRRNARSTMARSR